MPIEQKPIPPKEELVEFYCNQSKSNYFIAKQYGVSETTSKNWLLGYGIFYLGGMYKKQNDVTQGLVNENIIDAEYVIQNEQQNEAEVKRGDLVEFERSPLAEIDEEEDLTPFGMCTRRQQQFIIAYVNNLNDGSPLTMEQLSQKLGFAHSTCTEYLRNELVKTAIKELDNSNFDFSLNNAANQRLLNLFATGKDRPEDRGGSIKSDRPLSGDLPWPAANMSGREVQSWHDVPAAIIHPPSRLR